MGRYNMKLIDLLQEIGKTSKVQGSDDEYVDISYKTTTTKESEYKSTYEFTTIDSEGNELNKYEIQIYKKEIASGWILEVGFAILRRGKGDLSKIKTLYFDKEVNDPKNMYKVMATVVKTVKQEMEKMKQQGKRVVRIEFEPTKRKIASDSGLPKDDPSDERRANFYIAYVKKEFPGAKIESTATKDKIWVDIL